MVDSALQSLARKLYQAAAQCHPTWEQLGTATKGVWLERAELKRRGVADWWSVTKLKGYAPPRIPLTEITRRLHGLKAHHRNYRREGMSELNLAKVAEQLDEIAALFTALGGTFRDAGGAVKSAGKPGKAAGKSAGKSSAKVEAGDDEVTIDDLRALGRELVTSKGKEKLLEAFEAVGAAKLDDVDESQYSELKGKMQELIDAEDEEEEAKPKGKAAAKKPAGKKAKGPTVDDVVAAASALKDATDVATLKKALKKLGVAKASEVDEENFQEAIDTFQGMMPEDDDLL